VPLHCMANAKPLLSVLMSLSVQSFLMLSALLYCAIVSSRKASKSAELTQTLALIGVSWNAELRLSVSYMPGVNGGLGSSSGADVWARAADAKAKTMHADETSRCLTDTRTSLGRWLNTP